MYKKFLLFIFIIVLIVLGFSVAGHHHKSSSDKPKTVGTYVALGDSVAAGDGLETYSDASACDRTNQSYPDIVATKLNYKLDDLACSGATIDSGITGEQDVNDLNLTPQLTKLFELKKPNLITITIGANDVMWTKYIQECYEGTCDTPANSQAVDTLLGSLSTNLSSVITAIKNHYKQNLPEIIVTGYHQVFPDSNVTCSDLTGINSSEISWARQQQSELNATIASVVSSFNFAKFAPINFSGHELCTSDPWVQGLEDNAPYHPNDAGQMEFAHQVLSTIKEF